jgi:alanyl aminopeptidase
LRTALRLVAVLVAQALLAPAAKADPAPPALRLDGLAVPQRAAVDLTLFPEQDTYQGTIVYELELTAPHSVLWLNATALSVDSAAIVAGGKTVAAKPLAGGEQFVGLAFATPVPAGKATLTVHFTAGLEKTDTTGLFRQEDSGNWYIYSQFESTYARRAFPCFDEPSFKHPWQLTLHVRRDQVAVSNTPVLAEKDEADGMKGVTFTTTPPLPSYLVALGVGPFDIVDAGVAGSQKTPVRIIVPKGKAAEAAWAAEVTGEILGRLETYFGIPYPYGKLDNLVIPQTVGFGAMENPGLVTYAERSILQKPGQSTEERRRGYAGTCAHELAHQWFGDLVTTAWWDDIWLNEGFATWMGSKIIEQWKPEWGGAVGKVERRSQAMAADSLVSARRVRQPIASEGDILNAFDGITYGKGGALLSQFEAWMGEETFRRGVRAYLQKHAHGNATSADFLAALSVAGGAEIGPAFASFLDQPGAPVLSVELRCATGQAPSLALAQRRYFPLGSPGGEAQQWQIPVRVRYAVGGSEQAARLLMTTPTATLPLAAGACPDRLLANDGGLGYYLAAYQGGGFGKLLAGGAEHLTLPEQEGLLRDASALARSGDLPVAELLAALPSFVGSASRDIVESAIQIVNGLRDMVGESQQARYAAYVQALFGARTRELGFAIKPTEDPELALLRPRLLDLVGDNGEDRALRTEAKELALRWLADRSAVPFELSGVALSLAAIDGDVALFDRYLAATKASTDRRERRQLLSALGSFRDPALQDRALSLVLGSDFDIRETWSLLFGVGSRPAGRERMWAWLQTHFDAYAAALPAQGRPNLPGFARGFCDQAHHDAAQAFFAERIRAYEGGERNLAQTLEGIQLCTAYRAKQGESLRAFLAAQ